MKATTPWLLLALAGPLQAQNLLVNGDFGNGLNGWTQTGYSYNPQVEVFDTTGLGASPCYGCNPGGQAVPAPYPANSIDQSVVLVAGLAYELSADVSLPPAAATVSKGELVVFSAEVSAVVIATVTLPGNVAAPLPAQMRARLCGRFVPQATGPALLSVKFQRSLQLATATSMRAHIDNVSLAIATGPTFNVEGSHRIGLQPTFATAGAAGAPYAVAIATGVLPVGVPIPGATGLWFLAPAATTVLLNGTLDANGKASVALAIPSDPYLTLAPLYFQAVHVVSGTLGIGFHHAALLTL
jgi:hypothetical protein